MIISLLLWALFRSHFPRTLKTFQGNHFDIVYLQLACHQFLASCARPPRVRPPFDTHGFGLCPIRPIKVYSSAHKSTYSENDRFMKQLVQYLRTGETKVVEVPVPSVQPGMVLVRTVASLVSAGTERMVFEFGKKTLIGKVIARPDLARQVFQKTRQEGILSTLQTSINRLDQPLAMGYSSAGIVEEIGQGVESVKVGQHVACAGGGHAVHAEFVLVPKNLLAVVPEHVDLESAAFSTLGAIAMHGFRLSGASLGERVAVIGLGLLGLLAVQIAKAGGCQVFGIDLDPYRLDLARQTGVHLAVLRENAETAAAAFTRGLGFDAILICADTPSADPVRLAGSIARDRARVIAIGSVGQEIPRKIYYEKELTFINSRSYGPGRYDPSFEDQGIDYPIGYVRWTETRNLQAFVELLAAGHVDVKSLITHRFPIESADQAYTLISGRTGQPFLGVLITYSFEKPSDVKGARITVNSNNLEPAYQVATSCSLGVLGAGNFAASVMLPVIQGIPEIEKVGIASARGLSAQAAAARFGFKYATSDETQILSDTTINTVAVFTRHNLHARQVISALQAGKHVFCEKPLAIEEEELIEIEKMLTAWNSVRELISSHSTEFEHRTISKPPILMVGFNRRFSPFAQKIKSFLSGRTEPVMAHYRVNAGYLAPTHWLHDPAIGGGRLIGEACHFIDFLTFIIGALPTSVQGQALPDLGRYREDNFVLHLSYPDGSIGILTYLANGDKSFPKERLEVYSGGAVIVLDDFRSLKIVTNGKSRQFTSHWRQDKGHRAEWLIFLESIKAGGPPPIPYDILFGVARTALVAVDAIRSGNRIPLQ